MYDKPIRHGEVMLVPVKRIPKGISQKLTSLVVGDSDNGHNHVLQSAEGFEVIETPDKDVFFIITSPARLIHEKTDDRHRDLDVPKGLYERYSDTEYDAYEKRITAVRD